MEDAHVAATNVGKFGVGAPCHLFGVFDGHGGTAVSRFAAEYFPSYLREGNHHFRRGQLPEALVATFQRIDNRMTKPAGLARLREIAAQAQREGAAMLDDGTIDSDDDGSGGVDLEEFKGERLVR